MRIRRPKIPKPRMPKAPKPPKFKVPSLHRSSMGRSLKMPGLPKMPKM